MSKGHDPGGEHDEGKGIAPHPIHGGGAGGVSSSAPSFVSSYVPSVRHLIVALLFAMALAAAASGGPDYSRYEDWGIAGLSGTLWEARVYTISPQGVPLMMWAHGSGFVFAAADLLTPAWLDFRGSAMLVGWLGALLLWAAMLRTLWIVAGGDAVLTLLGAALFFVATHGGYYSHIHASESLALAATGLLVWLAFEPRSAGRLAFLVAGLSLAFLVIIKPYWVLYGAGTLAVLSLRTLRDGGSRTALVGRLALAAAPVVVAVAQTALTNRWMTGSWLRSSYQFGDATFRSFDFANPEFAAVLVHPWHGLLAYHPFYALGALAVLLVAVAGVGSARAADRAFPTREGSSSPVLSERRIFFGLAAAAMAANLHIQAAWIVWWLGRATFGMRGLAPAAAIVVPAFVLVAVHLQRRSAAMLGAWTGVAFACALWSATLLATGVGPQFHTYAQMLAGMGATLDSLTVWRHGIPLLLCFVGIGALLQDVWRPAAGIRRAVAGASVLLLSLALVYLVGEGLWVMRERSAAVAVAAALLLALSAAGSVARRRLPMAQPPPVLALLAVAQTVLFVIAAVLFFRLAARVEDDIAAGRRPPHNYAYVNTFSTRDMKDSCNEYRHLPAFHDKRDAFKAFLIRNGVGAESFLF